MFKKIFSRVSNNEADDDLSSLPSTKHNIFKETLSTELILIIAQYLPIGDLNSFARSDEYLLEMIFDLTVEKVEAIAKRKQELLQLDLESRIVSVKDQYKENETALAQTLLWKPLVLYYFPNYSASLNVKNWMHVMRRRVIHLQNKFPQELPLSKIIKEESGPLGSKFRKNKDRQFIENCDWEYECPLKKSTAFRHVSKGVSFCAVCKENVYEVISDNDFEHHVKQGHCVSFSKYLVEEKRPLMRGKIAYRPANNH
ncbi:predicted protein [Naegleria gruberi]|uniref:Predicted protein n=1 Tax=Naegleria gruberi TaxID=5762 RepID=D2W4P7_NAEGR|nr:uncharacterized protein NAEGRDRAFT_54654 [Naegleria gruberi]EFC35954.1 predicted protein [Naegleria gruberi]|eukprot:XP_002668698.1 predicted protein [Naegleria gruberi strain NEG-M]